MKIPKIISRYGRQYIYVKEYPNFYLYKDMYTGANETFNEDELRNNVSIGKGNRKGWKEI